MLLLHGVQSSRTTWWRVADDLRDLGWDVVAVNMIGHGGRRHPRRDTWTVQDLASDVFDQVRRPSVDLVVGHSLGAVVALTLAGLHPGFTRAVVAEDPPGLGGPVDPRDVADDIEQTLTRTRADPPGEVRDLLSRNPAWARLDATHAVDSQLALDVAGVTGFLRRSRWYLSGLIRQCPVPVHLLAATEPGTALLDPDRTAVISALPAERLEVIASGHAIHRDRPGLWLTAVLRFAAE